MRCVSTNQQYMDKSEILYYKQEAEKHLIN